MGNNTRRYEFNAGVHAIIKRALVDRINALHAAAAEVVRVANGDGKRIAQPLLEEAQSVGEVLDAMDRA